MSVLVTGANGLLGSVIVDKIRKQGIDVVGTYHSDSPKFEPPLVQLDIRNTDNAMRYIMEYGVDTLINCAAATDVDACESSPSRAHEINATAPGTLAGLCADHGIDFVHFSTDYVFDGESTKRHAEDDQPHPIQEYGVSKHLGERAVCDSNPDALIIRLSFVYGARGDTGELVGFPSWVAETLHEKDEVPLFTDQQFTPSQADQVATTMLALLETDPSGIFHIACRSCVTPYEFGELVCDMINVDETLLTPTSIGDLDRPAKRPRDTCLDVSKVEQHLGRPQPTLRDDLAAVLESFTNYSL